MTLPEFIAFLASLKQPMALCLAAPMSEEWPKPVVVTWKRYHNSVAIHYRAFTATQSEFRAAMEIFDSLNHKNQN